MPAEGFDGVYSPVHLEATKVKRCRRIPVNVVVVGLDPICIIARPEESLWQVIVKAIRIFSDIVVHQIKVMTDQHYVLDSYASLLVVNSMKIVECDLMEGRVHILILPQTPHWVKISVIGPLESTPSQEINVQQIPGWRYSWSKLQDMACAQNSFSMPANAVSAQWGLDYEQNGMLKQSFFGFKNNTAMQADEIDGKQVDWQSLTHYVCRFLAPYSGIRCHYTMMPVVTIWSDCDVLSLGPRGQLCKITDIEKGLFHPQWLLFLCARRCYDEKQRLWRTFFLLRDRSYVDWKTGCEYKDELAIRSVMGGGQKKWRRAILLFKSHDMLPKVPLPVDKNIAIYKRRGVLIGLWEHRLLSFGDGVNDGSSMWLLTPKWHRDELSEVISKSMRDVPKKIPQIFTLKGQQKSIYDEHMNSSICKVQ